MEGNESDQGAGKIPGGSDRKIIFAAIAVALVILAAVVIAKAGFGIDLVNPANGQMSLVHGQVATIPVTIPAPVPTTRNLGITMATPSFQPTRFPGYKICPAGMTGCNGVCVNANTDPQNCGGCGTVCPATATCTAGQCLCPGGVPTCRGGCMNYKTDTSNCGGCGNVCPAGTSCTNGGCQCLSGKTLCGGTCRDLSTDAGNCGSCGNDCSKLPNVQAASCSSGKCVIAQCGCDAIEMRSNDCDKNPLNGCESIPVSDPNNCGRCGVKCQADTPYCDCGECHNQHDHDLGGKEVNGVVYPCDYAGWGCGGA